jgi:hypothetical protein
MEVPVIDDHDDGVSVEFELYVFDTTLKLCDVNGPAELA